LGKLYHAGAAPIGIKLEGQDFLQKRASENYEQFYGRGGWTYDADVECAFRFRRILRPLGIRPKSRILELGCGVGLHSRLLADLGMSVTGVDVSPAGIKKARQYECKEVEFHFSDAADFLKSAKTKYAVVFARGMSWFHYELEPGTNRHGVNIDDNMIGIDCHIECLSLTRSLHPSNLY
jgi:SAM-dependent methyltransferase